MNSNFAPEESVINTRTNAIPLWKRPFLYLSGTDIRTISRCGPDVATRYSILGGLVCIPAIVAFFSSRYAATLLTDNTTYQWAIGFVWAIVILIIDRSIVAQNPEIEDVPIVVKSVNLSKGAKQRSRFVFIARIVISFVLGIVVAEPLSIRVFDDNVQEQLKNSKALEFSQKERIIDSFIANSKKQVDSAERTWKNSISEATKEIEGKAHSQLEGPGPRFIHKMNVVKTFRDEYDKALAANRATYDSLIRVKAKLKEEINDKKAVGLTGQMEALNELAASSVSMFIAILMIRLLFICIELIPIFLKGSLKRKSDSYVVLCHQNNQKSIDLNESDANNLAARHMLYANLEEDIRINRKLKKRKIESIAADFDFSMRVNQEAAESFEREQGKIEQVITDQNLRKEAAAVLAEAYKAFLKNLDNLYKKD